MPDLKSEMSKVLEAWEQDVEQLQKEKTVQALPQQFTPTNNVSRETFNYVRDNPNCTSSDIRSALTAQGFNAGSVGSLITQFTKQNQFARDHKGRYKALVREYIPLKSTRKFRAEGTRVNNIVTKPKSAGIAALKVDTTPKVIPKTDIQSILNGLSILQARALYDELKKIFGG